MRIFRNPNGVPEIRGEGLTISAVETGRTIAIEVEDPNATRLIRVESNGQHNTIEVTRAGETTVLKLQDVPWGFSRARARNRDRDCRRESNRQRDFEVDDAQV